MHLIPSTKQITYHPNYKLDSMRYPGLIRGRDRGGYFGTKYGKPKRSPVPSGAVGTADFPHSAPSDEGAVSEAD